MIGRFVRVQHEAGGERWWQFLPGFKQVNGPENLRCSFPRQAGGIFLFENLDGLQIVIGHRHGRLHPLFNRFQGLEKSFLPDVVPFGIVQFKLGGQLNQFPLGVFVKMAAGCHQFVKFLFENLPAAMFEKGKVLREREVGWRRFRGRFWWGGEEHEAQLGTRECLAGQTGWNGAWLGAVGTGVLQIVVWFGHCRSRFAKQPAAPIFTRLAGRLKGILWAIGCLVSLGSWKRVKGKPPGQ